MWKISLAMLAWVLVGCSVVDDVVDKVETALDVEYHVRCTYKVTCFPGPEVIDQFTEDKCMSNQGQRKDREGWNEDCEALRLSIHAEYPGDVAEGGIDGGRCANAKCEWDCYQTDTLPCL